MRVIWGSAFAILSAAVLTYAVRALAHRIGAVSAPRKDRWHRKPTAMLGGVAIYASFMLCYLIFAPKRPAEYAILASATLLFFTGLVDDMVQIKPYAKLIVQLAAAAIVVYFGVHLPWTRYEAVNDFITIVWLVGITNAINLLDNMDGLAAGITLISCLFLGVTFFINGQIGQAAIVAILAGSALGFLFFNFQPATIFMGDCGSMFLGFVLGGTALMSDYGRSRNLASVLFTPVLILAIPIFDTCVVTVTRKLSGRPISQGGRDHTSHRLVALGLPERKAVVMIYLMAAVSGLIALSVRLLNTEVALLLVPGFALMVLFVGLYLGKVRISQQEEQRPDNTIITAVTDFTYKRRVFEVSLDLVLVILAYYGAYLLRWDGSLPREQLAIFIKTLPLLIVIQMSFLLLGGVYQGLWRYTGANELVVIAKSVFLGAAVSAAFVFPMYWFHGPSRAVFLLDMLLLVTCVGASRMSFRLLKALIVGPLNMRPGARPVLIYGADDGGDLLYRMIVNNPDHAFAPVGFIDDDVRKTGKLIHGQRIFGTGELPALMQSRGVSDVLIADPRVPESKLAGLRDMGACLRMVSITIE
jgi:UDP-GlcNAc:undecaprenyl-phosphate GlcNAc-1-phosphate transferase